MWCCLESVAVKCCKITRYLSNASCSAPDPLGELMTLPELLVGWEGKPFPYVPFPRRLWRLDLGASIASPH